MIRISMDVSGAERVLGAVGERLSHLEPGLRAAGHALHRSIMKNFQLGGRPRWKPLKDGSGRRPLVLTGRLRDSVTVKASPGGVSVGTGLRYAALHQFGGRAGIGHSALIPARPFLAVQPEDPQALQNAITDYLTGG